MSFSSTVQILKVNEVEKGVSKRTGQEWQRHTAECMLLSDDGEIECVGRLVIPKALQGTVQRGTFRASFTLAVPTFGDRKGDITAELVGLVSVAPKQPAAPARAA